jgi:hypothetical protein
LIQRLPLLADAIIGSHAARLPRSFFERGLGSNEILSPRPVALAKRLSVDRLGFAFPLSKSDLQPAVARGSSTVAYGAPPAHPPHASDAHVTSGPCTIGLTQSCGIVVLQYGGCCIGGGVTHQSPASPGAGTGPHAPGLFEG